MDESILNSVKKLLGIGEDYDYFDKDVVLCINSVFTILNQLGVGPEECFTIEDESETWSSFLSDAKNLELVKTYVYMKVKKMFDPPSSGAVMDSLDKMISEMEWRINVTVDPATS